MDKTVPIVESRQLLTKHTTVPRKNRYTNYFRDNIPPYAKSLTNLRLRTGFSQERLAELIGNTDRSYVSKIELGQRNGSSQIMSRAGILLCENFDEFYDLVSSSHNCSWVVDYFLEEKFDQEVKNRFEQEIKKACRQFSIEQGLYHDEIATTD